VLASGPFQLLIFKNDSGGDMKNLYATLLAAAVCIGSAGAAEAAIQSVDWDAAAHDQWLTRDTASGLDWLDVSLTNGLSVQQVLAGDWVKQGFRYATQSEISSLVSHTLSASLPPSQAVQGLAQQLGAPERSAYPFDPSITNVPLYELYGFVVTPSALDGSLQVLSAQISPGIDSGGSVVTDPVGGYVCILVCEPGAHDDFLHLIESAGGGSTYLYFRTASATDAAPWLGSYLVRATAAVPEPSTWALLAAGAFALAAAARRHPR
jgi:hypothetical protein